MRTCTAAQLMLARMGDERPKHPPAEARGQDGLRRIELPKTSHPGVAKEKLAMRLVPMKSRRMRTMKMKIPTRTPKRMRIILGRTKKRKRNTGKKVRRKNRTLKLTRKRRRMSNVLAPLPPATKRLSCMRLGARRPSRMETWMAFGRQKLPHPVTSWTW